MNFLFRKIKIFKTEVSFIVLAWFALALAAALVEVLRYTVNDYLIFKGVFWHLLQQKNLYAEYPAECIDSNHYGPVFGILIAPFAILPTGIGGILWAMLQAWILLYAVWQLPFTKREQLMVLAISLIEMMTTTHNLQFNCTIAAWLILSFVLVEKEKDFWATLWIALGFLTKLYGIGGLLFFVFSRHKLQFVLSFLFWMAVLFCLPMLIASPKFVVQSYYDWYASLVEKNAKNMDIVRSGAMQDISVMGMIRRITGWTVNNLVVLMPATLLIVAPLFRFRQYQSLAFRLSYLAIVLISVVIFSTGAESSLYVIAMIGVGIWYLLHHSPGSIAVYFVLVLALVLTSLSPTDLFPSYINLHYVRPYSLKALPCFIVWLWLIADVFSKNFLQYKRKRYEES